jgi:hypothetical protein
LWFAFIQRDSLIFWMPSCRKEDGGSSLLFLTMTEAAQ